MEDLLQRLKDWKTTSIAVAIFIVKIANDLGYTITLSVDDLSNYLTYVIAAGFLLSGGKSSK